MIEHRIRKHVREDQSLKQTTLVCMGSLTTSVIESITRRHTIETIEEQPSLEDVQAINDKVLIIPWTADHESLYFLNNISNGITTMPFLGKRQNILKLFLPITEQEMILFCEYKNLTYNPLPSSPMLSMLAPIAQKQPQVMNALGKSVTRLAKIVYKDL